MGGKNKKSFISIIMPCLNEEKSIGKCIKKANLGLKKVGYRGEIIVCDNGSLDRSVAIARECKAKVVFEKKRGYGNAYLRGLKSAKGDLLIIGDSDSTYDFLEIGKFIRLIEDDGFDYISGTRIRGVIKPGAMPFLHRYIGVPFLSWMINVLFNTNVSDAHCGIRAFKRSAYKKMRLAAGGMEFASELIIKASLNRLKIAEIPIIYYAREGKSKLRPIRDGFRHLFFIVDQRWKSLN